MYTAWLIAIDGSTPSLNGVDYVIREAAIRTETPQVLLINVQVALSSDITRFVDVKTVEEFHQEEGKAALAEAKAKLSAAGLSYSAHILIGKAAPTIVEFAKEKGCSHDRHGFSGGRRRSRGLHGLDRSQSCASLIATGVTDQVALAPAKFIAFY
ncbi:MAG: universal stress protein [Rhodoferax sp.]